MFDTPLKRLAAEIRRFINEDHESKQWGGPTIPPRPIDQSILSSALPSLKEVWPSETFCYGQPVRKKEGYKFDGFVVSAFNTMAGKIRIVVDNGDGLLHIFNEDQMEPREG